LLLSDITVLYVVGSSRVGTFHYGSRYHRTRYGVHSEDHDDTINPVHYWECGSGGFPPAGMTFYDADGFIDWQGDLFVGGLASEYLAHFRVTGNGLEELDPLLEDEGWRVRDVTTVHHDGAIYAAVDGQSVSNIREPTHTGDRVLKPYVGIAYIFCFLS